MSVMDQFTPYIDNFAEMLMIASHDAGGGPNVRFKHFKNAVIQLNKPVMLTAGILEEWKIKPKEFSDLMEEYGVPRCIVDIPEIELVLGVLIFSSDEQMESFSDDLERAGGEKVTVEKPILN